MAHSVKGGGGGGGEGDANSALLSLSGASVFRLQKIDRLQLFSYVQRRALQQCYEDDVYLSGRHYKNSRAFLIKRRCCEA